MRKGMPMAWFRAGHFSAADRGPSASRRSLLAAGTRWTGLGVLLGLTGADDRHVAMAAQADNQGPVGSWTVLARIAGAAPDAPPARGLFTFFADGTALRPSS